MTVDELEKQGFDQSMVNRAAIELEEKKLVEVQEETEIDKELTEKGEKVLDEGSPEYQLLEKVQKGPAEISDLEVENKDVALGKAREKGWIEISAGKVSITDEGHKSIDQDDLRFRLETENYISEHENRGLIETVENITRTLKTTNKAAKTDPAEIEVDFNVEAEVKTLRTGKKPFYKEIITEARQKWIEMGFQEMQGDYVVSSLLNFDALYTPQDHPAREMHDTFFLSKPEKPDLSDLEKIKQRIKETHEDGWTTGSKGWNYDWSEDEAARNVLRTHTTAVSARKLSELDEEDLPAKYFTVARNFRNETIDRFHLPEFFQTDGIVVGKDLSFTHLKAYISEFFHKMGYEEFRLIPSYYPYTEMSVEVQVYDNEEDEWIGLGGAGKNSSKSSRHRRHQRTLQERHRTP
ncbi:MAG: phenylalanine--tRNA ligase subunit alpha [Nanohaloarchaea archaeon SW_7_46_7]|nr:MAG: phenylalanine--tRNA ligase subunit alpha [Nanohaloarchaea archaeon SW_7_46_7]